LGGEHPGEHVIYYRVQAKDDDAGEAYWVAAESEEHARRLVALNAESAREAEDSSRFECESNHEKHPPFGLIYRRLHGPLTITKR
jgi:hypothetical protein